MTCVESRATESRRLLNGGLVALVVANVGSYVVQRKHLVPESVADPVSGFLMGTAIAMLLIAVYRQGRPPRREARRDE